MKQVLMQFFSGLLVLFFAVTVHAQTFRVSDIRVEGLQRVSAGTVFSALPIRVGDTLTQADIQSATRELFKVGYFSDVAIKRDGDVLVLVIKERPAINKIELKGNKAIKTENLMDSLKENNLSEGQIFQRATLEGITQALQREYVNQGRYGASVKIEIEDMPRNQVKVLVKIDEGSPSRIKMINIVGNTKYTEEELIELFELKTTGMWSWITGNDKYNKEKMKGDLERLESWYMDRGYLNFKIDSSQISLSPDKSKIFITVNITEGDIYNVSSVELAGDPAIDEQIIRSMILMRSGQIFSQILMTTSEEYVTKRLGNEGYTFAKVEGMPERNDADKTVKITFFIEPGKRAYVNRVNFRGNTKTVDEVLRREMRQMEGGSANSAQIENSKVRLERLGFFKEVKVENKEVPGTSDQIDVEYTVEEQPSGSMGLQVGYAQYSGLLFSASIQQNNWFGTGKQVGFSFSHNRYQTAYNFNYNDPYFTPDGVSRGVNLYYTKSDYGSYNITPYSTNVYGGKLNFGYPVSDIERLGFDIGLRSLEVTPTSYSSQEIIRSPIWNNEIGYITQGENYDLTQRAYNGFDFPAGSYETKPITESMLGPKGFLDIYGDTFNDAQASVYWLRSTLNRGVLANRGAQQQISFEISLPGGDLEYYKLNYNGQVFVPLTNALTLRLHTRLGYAESYGGLDELPFFENYYAGGFGSVRGFERNTLGPRSTYIRSAVTSPTIWDDLNGDGIPDAGETGGTAYVLCEDPDSPGDAGNIDCVPGELITNANNNNYVGRNRGAFGGNVLIQGGAEVLFPLPFIKDQRSIQTTFFLDAGNVFDTNCGKTQLNCYDVDVDHINASVGLGLTWISGFGPMTFSIAEPIRENEYDRTEVFQFSLGQTF
ncbi:outer membrane protein assembly factor BamA [Cellvibrio sp. KY-GH-1]|uniref:outer membrane protein assembly factor BamA n=1 Tax=Cellvibrio sp. KY-GH-1 TaxID=2303332 RepID=UPI001249060E|nr:outer membrane protein assembly factor BamA [Cellvibrio sp. KY-GH-1]QEY16145.1 outer membrane protein assembly factor BamA [Cellvibrio sp. KY-GH-1]